MQAKVRQQFGGLVTAFDRVADGTRTLQKGDALRMSTKPILAGRAVNFLVGQVWHIYSCVDFVLGMSQGMLLNKQHC